MVGALNATSNRLPEAGRNQPAEKGRTTVVGAGIGPEMLEGLAAMEAVDIVSIEALELQVESGSRTVITSLTFQNRNPFPIFIKSGRLAAAFHSEKGSTVKLGTLHLSDLLLNGMSLNGFGSTRVDTRVRYKGDPEDLRLLGDRAGAGGASAERVLPLSVEGTLDVAVTVMSGMKIEKSVEVMLDFEPKVSRDVLARFEESIDRAARPPGR